MFRHLFLISALLFTFPAMAQKSPVEIGLTDLKLDIASMTGQTVRVKGLIQVMGEIILLKSELMDMSPLMVGSSHLSREDRKKLLTVCTVMCEGIIVGKIGPSVFGSSGLDATKLENIEASGFSGFFKDYHE